MLFKIIWKDGRTTGSEKVKLNKVGLKEITNKSALILYKQNEMKGKISISLIYCILIFYIFLNFKLK